MPRIVAVISSIGGVGVIVLVWKVVGIKVRRCKDARCGGEGGVCLLVIGFLRCCCRPGRCPPAAEAGQVVNLK